jgi:hypothetical protein
MAQANRAYHSGALTTALRYYAKQAVKEHWRSQGLKPQYIEPRQLHLAAEAWLSEHWAELLPKAEARLP